MATQATPDLRPQPGVDVTRGDAPIDVRLWARQYVAIILNLEGVSITPTTIAEAR